MTTIKRKNLRAKYYNNIKNTLKKILRIDANIKLISIYKNKWPRGSEAHYKAENTRLNDYLKNLIESKTHEINDITILLSPILEGKPVDLTLPIYKNFKGLYELDEEKYNFGNEEKYNFGKVDYRIRKRVINDEIPVVDFIKKQINDVVPLIKNIDDLKRIRIYVQFAGSPTEVGTVDLRHKEFTLPYDFDSKTFNYKEVIDYFKWSDNMTEYFPWLTAHVLPLNDNNFKPSNNLFNLLNDKNRKAKSLGTMVINNVLFNKLPFETLSDSILYKKHCVTDLFTLSKENNDRKHVFPKLNNWYNKNKDNNNVWDVNNLVKVLKDVSQPHKIIDRYNKIYSELKIGKSHRTRMLYGLVQDEHLYPMTHKQYIDFKKYMKSYDVEIDNINYVSYKTINKTYEELSKKYIIEHFRITKTLVKSPHLQLIDYNDGTPYSFVQVLERFYCNETKTLYVSDKEIYDVYTMFKTIYPDCLGLCIPFDISSNKLFYFLSEKYKLNSICNKSFDIPSPIYYSNNSIKDDKMSSYRKDQKKAYLTISIELEKIPIIDYSCQMMPYDAHKIILTNFYHISEIKNKVCGVIKNGWCSGYEIDELYISKKNYEIDYFIVPKLVDNIFSPILKKFRDYDLNLTRNIWIKYVGCMQRKNNETSKEYYNYIFNNDDEIYEGAVTYNLYDTKLKCDVKEVLCQPYHDNTMLPFAHYVIGECKRRIYASMSMLKKNIPESKILYINTDCLGFQVPCHISKTEIDKLFDNNYWKDETIKKLTNSIRETPNINTPINLKISPIPEIENYNIDENTLIDSYAGCGKTHFIINKLLPKIPESKRYIVLANQHNVLSEYRRLDINCNLIHKYIGSKKDGINKLSNYDYIIIDEFGLFDYDQLNKLIKETKKKTKFHFFGDSEQLKPVLHKMENINFSISNYFKNFFDNIYTIPENHRNNFKSDDYSKMINGTYDYINEMKYMNNDRIIEVLNNNLSPFIITPLNDTCNEYNNGLAEYNEWYELGNNKYVTNIKDNPNNRIRSDIDHSRKSKDVTTLVKLGIYNSMYYRIIDFTIIKEDNNITLGDVTIKRLDISHDTVVGESIIIDSNLYLKYFSVGYCSTIHKVQGLSIPENQICIVGVNSKNNREMYTSISRLKL